MTLKPNYNLEGGFLINFVKLRDKERKLVRRWRNHQKIRKWMYDGEKISQSAHADFIKELAKESRRFYWLVQDHNRENVGVIYLLNCDFKNRHAYIGIYTNPLRKVKGAGAFLISLLKNIAFKIAGFHSLKLEVLVSNKRAIRFYEKSGFKMEGLLRDYVWRSGKWVDVMVMGITIGK